MKKLLFSLAVACCGLAISSNAQILSQDFESVTMPALPAGWTLGGSTGSPAWYTSASAGGTWGTLTGYYALPAHTQYVVVDDAANPNQLHDTLFSPVFSLSGTTSVWLNFDCFFYGATNNTSHLTEHAYVLGSTNGGTTWSVIDSVLPYGWNGSTWTTQHTSLASLSGANCRLAYTYTDGGGAILGCAIDNIKVVNLTASDAAVNSISYNSSVNGISINGETVSFTIQNNGIPITTLNMYYTINGAGYVAQTFSPTGFTPYTSQTFTFTTAMAGAIAGTNLLHVGISTVNGVVTPDVDSFKTSSFLLASASTQRSGLVEEFTSSTCPPCASFASSFDPLCTSLNANSPSSHFNIIKYQMNWPDWNDDRSYNSDGLSRRNYYSCNSIPEHLVNGVVDNAGWSVPFTSAQTTYFTNEFAAAAANKAFMDMTVTYAVDTILKKLYTTTKVTPHFTNTNTYHLYIAAADQHYQNIGNEWGMLNYYHVMRKMFPSGGGRILTSPTDGVAQTFYDTGIVYTSGNWVPASTVPADSAGLYPHQMSNTFWSNPLLGSELVAFVQEDATKSIMQSIVAPAIDGSSAWEHHLAVSTVSQVNGINIFPNPAREEATLRFTLGVPGNVEINVMEYSGRMVSNVMNKSMAAGDQKVVIPTKNIVPGNYIIVIKTDSGTNAERLTVEK